MKRLLIVLVLLVLIIGAIGCFKPTTADANYTDYTTQVRYEFNGWLYTYYVPPSYSSLPTPWKIDGDTLILYSYISVGAKGITHHTDRLILSSGTKWVMEDNQR